MQVRRMWMGDMVCDGMYGMVCGSAVTLLSGMVMVLHGMAWFSLSYSLFRIGWSWIGCWLGSRLRQFVLVWLRGRSREREYERKRYKVLYCTVLYLYLNKERRRDRRSL